jgi:Putative papain-like cysteine peptidase (DUF1796)
MVKSTITYTASLGTHCYSAWLLDRIGARKYAGPFDWLFSDLGMITHCIEDNFQIFLDASKYVMLDQHGHYGHSFYGPRFDRTVIFNHHDVTQAKDYAHFVRAVERFRRLLSSKGTKIFLSVSVPSRATDARVKALSNAIWARTTDAQILIVSVQSNTASQTKMAGGREIGIAKIFDLWATSDMMSGLSFRSDADNRAIACLFDPFQFDITDPLT